MAKAKKSAEKPAVTKGRPNATIYTLDVTLIGGPISEAFAKKNPVVSRTIEVRGDQTLEDLHDALFAAFDRDDHHLYEFQFGKKPMDRKATRYGAAVMDDFGMDDDDDVAGTADQVTFDALKLKVRAKFFYWFDFGDDWWHEIKVAAIEDKTPSGKYPKVTRRVGDSPPQYPGVDDEEEE